MAVVFPRIFGGPRVEREPAVKRGRRPKRPRRDRHRRVDSHDPEGVRRWGRVHKRRRHEHPDAHHQDHFHQKEQRYLLNYLM